MVSATLKRPRLSLPEYLTLCVTQFKRHWIAFVVPLAALLVLQIFIRIDVNYTESLPDHVFITVKGWKSGLQRGDYVAYTFPTDNDVSLFRKGDHMVKIVRGVGGDRVERKENGHFAIHVENITASAVDSQLELNSIGIAKPFSKAGKALVPGPEGVIPKGSYYVYAPHTDSLDSRYAIVGWINDEHIIGRTFPIF
jgi:conjugal transfer pilin signal peptidase TrbI